MADVVLTKTKDYSGEEIGEAVSRALDTLNYDLNDRIDLVVIKPNLCYYWDYSTGETTDPRVVSAVIDWVRQKVGKAVCIVVAEADASAMRTRYAFKMLGYEKLSQEKNVKLVNLSQGEIVDRAVVVAGEKFVLPVNKILLDAKLMINVPKMKCHRMVGFTCALKNMFGAIAKPKKYSYHGKLAGVIVGINKILKSDIILVDGVIAKGDYPKKLGAILVGNDALATDFIVARVMGYNPKRIAYLNLAAKEKIGDINPINLLEDRTRLEEIKKVFPKHSYLLQNVLWNVQLGMLNIYAKITGDTIPSILEK